MKKGLVLSRRKVFYLWLIFSVFLLLIIFSVNTSLTYKNNRKETMNKIEMVTDSIDANLVRTIESIDNVSKSVFLNTEFQEQTITIYDENFYNNSVENIIKIFEKSVNSFDSLLIKDICYIPRNINGELDLNKFIHYGYSSDLFTSDFDLNLNRIVDKSKTQGYSNGKIFLSDLYSFGNLSDQICFCRNIVSLRTQNYNEQMGIGIVVVNKARFLDILNYSHIVDGFATSLSYDNEIIFNSNNLDDLLNNNNSIVKKTVSLGVYNWKLISFYDESYLFYTMKDNFINSIVIMVLIVGFYIMFYYMVHKKNLNTLYYMIDRFSQTTKDNELSSIEYIDDMEINQVIKAYNEMVESINSLNNKIIMEKELKLQYQLQRKDFEIKSLNSQINKHFIVNVLSIIRSLTNLNQIENANKCLENLSDFLRYSLTLDGETVIKDELNNVNSYLNIQSIRYSKITYKIECDECVENIRVPKLIIQPLVENAFVHGLKKKVGVIEVCCKKEDNVVLITVINDCISLSLEKLNEINKKLENCDEIESTSETSNGVALSNIQKRLRFMYGDNATIRLGIVDDNKTISIIKIKLDE